MKIVPFLLHFLAKINKYKNCIISSFKMQNWFKNFKNWVKIDPITKIAKLEAENFFETFYSIPNEEVFNYRNLWGLLSDVDRLVLLQNYQIMVGWCLLSFWQHISINLVYLIHVCLWLATLDLSCKKISHLQYKPDLKILDLVISSI